MADGNDTTIEKEEDESAAEAAPVAVDAPRLRSGDSVLQKLQTLPEVVRHFLLSPELAETHKRVFEKHGISEEDRELVYYTELQTFFGEIPVAEFPDRAWNRLDWNDDDEDKAAALLADIVGNVFLPAQALLGDVVAVLTDLGGDVAAYDVKPLAMREVSFVDGAKEIASGAGLDLDVDMEKRLSHILESRLRGVRVDDEVREMLMKPKKTGGLELDDESADRVMKVLASKVRMTNFVESTAAAEKPAAEEQPAPAQKEHSAVEIKRIYSGPPEEQEAIKKRVERLMQVTEGDAAKMRDAYHQVLFPPDKRPTDPLYVVAGLIGLAQGDRFTEAVEQDDRYKTILRLWLQVNGRENEVAAYEETPTDPHFMNMILQLVLRGIAGYDVGESARYALRYINALKKQGYDTYADLVAFDMSKGEFRWKDVLELS